MAKDKKPKKGQRADGLFQTTKTINGVKKVFYGATLKEAEKERDEWVNKSSPKNYRDITLEDWIDEWLNTVKVHAIEKSSWERYESISRVHIIPVLGKMKLADIQTPDILSFISSRYNCVVCRKKKPTATELAKAKPISKRSVQYIFVTLNAAFEKARISKIISDNPCEGIDKPTVPRKLPKPLTKDEETRYLQKIAQHPLLYPISILALDSGCRSGELLGLKWSNVFFSSGNIQIENAKNESSDRKLPITQRAVKILRDYKKAQDQHKKELGIKYQDYDLVFAADNGRAIPNYEISKMFKRAAIKAGLRDDAKFHNLRDTHATELLEMGEHPFNVQARLGHATIQMTKNYSKVTGQHYSAMMQKLNKKRNGSSSKKVVKRQRTFKKISSLDKPES